MELSSRLHWCIIYCTLLVHIDDHVVAYLQLNNLYEVHLGKCQSRIKVLETLAAGTTEEIQVSWIKFWIVLLIPFEFRFSNWFLSFFFPFICRFCCQSCNKSRCDFVIQYFCSVPFLLLPSFLCLGIFLVPLGKCNIISMHLLSLKLWICPLQKKGRNRKEIHWTPGIDVGVNMAKNPEFLNYRIVYWYHLSYFCL